MSERGEWMSHPETKVFRKQLEARIEAYKNEFANGATLVIDNPFATHAYTAGIKGKIEEISEILEMMIEEE